MDLLCFIHMPHVSCLVSHAECLGSCSVSRNVLQLECCASSVECPYRAGVGKYHGQQRHGSDTVIMAADLVINGTATAERPARRLTTGGIYGITSVQRPEATAAATAAAVAVASPCRERSSDNAPFSSSVPLGSFQVPVKCASQYE